MQFVKFPVKFQVFPNPGPEGQGLGRYEPQLPELPVAPPTPMMEAMAKLGGQEMVALPELSTLPETQVGCSSAASSAASGSTRMAPGGGV
jgi:hypothetical protein